MGTRKVLEGIGKGYQGRMVVGDNRKKKRKSMRKRQNGDKNSSSRDRKG